MKLNEYITGYLLLTVFKEGFNISHHRIQYLSFVQPVAIKLCELIFPIQLPFSEHMFFQCMVCFQNHHGCCCFKTHSSFDANDGITYVNVAADAIWSSQSMHFLDGLHWMCKIL